MVCSRVGVALCCLTLPLLLLALSQAQDVATSDDVWTNFQTGEAFGLQAMHAGGTNDFVEREADGVPCVSTDGAWGKHWLCFDVPRAYVPADTPCRYTLLIRYLDAPKDGLITVRYHAAGDPMAQAIRFQRQGSGEWRDMVLRLDDAVFLNGTMGCADFAVHGFTDTGDPRAADVQVSGVWLSKRIMELHAEPSALPAGGTPEQRTSRIVAVLYTPGKGPAPDGTKVRFSADSGSLEPAEAATSHGVAEARFTADDKAGMTVVSASWEPVAAWVTVATVPGAEPLREGAWVGETFEEATANEPERTNADTSYAEIATEGARVGTHCLRIHYAFSSPAPGQSVVMYPLGLAVPGRPSAISLWLKGDEGGHHCQLLLQDTRGTVYSVMPPDRIVRPGWHSVTIPLTSYDDCWGPDADGVIDFPVTLVGLRLVGMNAGHREGDVFLDQVAAMGLFPADELVAESVAPPRSETGLLIPPPRDPPSWVVDNLRAIRDAQALWNEANKLTAAPAGANPEAIVAYQRLLELRPSPGCHWVLARLYYKAREFEKGLAELDTLLADPGLPYTGIGEDWLRIVRAWCLDGLGRREEAAAEYAKAKEALAAIVKPAPPAPALLPPQPQEGQGRAKPTPVRQGRVVEMMQAWCERGAKEALPFYRPAPHAGPDYVEVPGGATWATKASRGEERRLFATDGNPETFWSPNFVQKAGDFFELDLRRVIPDIARLVLDDDGATNIHLGDLPGFLRVEGSLDGVIWEELAKTQGDPFAVVDVTWQARPLRALRVTVTEETKEGDFGNWRIYEAYVYRKR